MFKRVSLKAKILAGSGVTLMILVILGLVILTSMATLEDSSEWVNHTHRVIEESMKIEAAAVDMETGMRGYLLAGKEEFLEPYKRGGAHFEQLVGALQKRVDDNPPQVELLGEIRKTISEWRSNVTEPTISLRREIGDAETMNDMAHLVGQAKGKTYFDKFRGQIGTFIKNEEELMIKRKKAVESSKNVVELKDTMKWVDHTHNVIEEAMKIVAAAVDMETGMRGYLLAGKEEFLEPYHHGKKEFQSRISQLKNTVDDNPAQVALLGEIETTIQEWQTDVTNEMIALRRSIGHSKTMDDMADVVAQARGKKYFDKFREQIGTFRKREKDLMATRQAVAAEATEAANTAQYIMGGGILFAIFVSLTVSFFLADSIARPFKNIFKGLKSFSTSELEGLQVTFEKLVMNINNGGQEVAAASQQIASGASEQAASIEETSASVEQIQAMVQDNLRFASEAAELSNRVSGSSIKAQHKMADLQGAMQEIHHSNEKIEELVKLIGTIEEKTRVMDEIVFQTKLLSFNASVEAERAGEHGRGFAVVAQEVGNLAKMSGESAIEIAQIVKGSVKNAQLVADENKSRVELGRRCVEDVATILNEVNEASDAVAAGSKMVVDASRDQSQSIDQITHAISELDKVTQQNAASTEELSSQAEVLKESVDAVMSVLRGSEYGTSVVSNGISMSESKTIDSGFGLQSINKFAA